MCGISTPSITGSLNTCSHSFTRTIQLNGTSSSVIILVLIMLATGMVLTMQQWAENSGKWTRSFAVSLKRWTMTRCWSSWEIMGWIRKVTMVVNQTMRSTQLCGCTRKRTSLDVRARRLLCHPNSPESGLYPKSISCLHCLCCLVCRFLSTTWDPRLKKHSRVLTAIT